MEASITERLEYLRSQIRAERISYGELAELQSLAEHIEPGDVELLEPAGVAEFPDENTSTFTVRIELGNDAMQTAEDVADALHRIAYRLDNVVGMPGRIGIRDANGNIVGDYGTMELPDE